MVYRHFYTSRDFRAGRVISKIPILFIEKYNSVDKKFINYSLDFNCDLEVIYFNTLTVNCSYND